MNHAPALSTYVALGLLALVTSAFFAAATVLLILPVLGILLSAPLATAIFSFFLVAIWFVVFVALVVGATVDSWFRRPAEAKPSRYRLGRARETDEPRKGRM